MYSQSSLLPVLTILETIEKITFYVRDITSADEFLWKDDALDSTYYPHI